MKTISTTSLTTNNQNISIGTILKKIIGTMKKNKLIGKILNIKLKVR